MEPETINSTDLRTKTRDLMERVKFNGDRFVVETFGRPMAVIISFEDFLLIKSKLIESSLKSKASKLTANKASLQSAKTPRRVRIK